MYTISHPYITFSSVFLFYKNVSIDLTPHFIKTIQEKKLQEIINKNFTIYNYSTCNKEFIDKLCAMLPLSIYVYTQE